MLESLMTIMSSSGVGAITGGLFGWLNRKEDRKMREADQRHEANMVGKKADAEISVSEAEAFVQSQITTSAVGDAIKSAVRPVITGFLCYMTFMIFMKLESMTGGISNLPPQEAYQLYRDITMNIISLTATAVSWWFASRPSSIK